MTAPLPPPDYPEMAIGYARAVLAGTVPACKWTKLAANRFVQELAREGTKDFPYRLDRDKGARVCRFVGQTKHVKGPLAGLPIKVEPWQAFVLVQVFGWTHSEGPREGLRRFRRVYIEVPRGNAKSTLSSAIALYCLAADGEGGAEVYSLATTRNQARIVFDAAQMMARKSPELSKALGLEVLAHSVIQMRSGSKFEALSAEHSSLDGLNVHLGIIDELHAHKTREVYDVIETGTGKRLQSLLWAITTAGSNTSGICYEVRSYLTKILSGVVEDPSVFGCIWSIDDGDQWTEESSWIKANPNYGVSVMPDVIGQLARKALTMQSAVNNFLMKHLNVWTSADSSWMDMKAWNRAADPTLDIADFEAEKCWIGLDLASKVDIAAKVRLFRRIENDDVHWYAFLTSYLPEAAVQDGRNASYSGWEREGRIVTTPGDVLDFDRVGEEVLEDASRFHVQSVAYDPWQAQQLANRLSSDGAPIVEYRATVQNFSSPMKELDALVRSGRFHHDGDPVLAWMASNVVCHTDVKENIYPRKERPENKIDGIVALIMTVGRSMISEEVGDLDDAIYNPVIV
jgi:phage terminase large subunit-like protein